MSHSNFIRSIGETTVIELKGRLDYSNAGALMEALKTLTGQGVKRLHFHCAGLEYISSAGIRAMVFSKQKIDKTIDMEVQLHHAAPQIKDVFALSGLDSYYDFID